MIWFKHYNTALTGRTLSTLIMQRNYAAIVLYFKILELASAQNNGGKVSIAPRWLAKEMNMKLPRCYNLVLTLLQLSGNLVLTKLEDSWEITVLNWSEFQENRGRSSRKKKEEIADIDIDLDKDKNPHISPAPSVLESESLVFRKPKNPETTKELSLANTNYPASDRPQEVQEGLKKLAAQVSQSDWSWPLFERAVRNYRAYCEKRDWVGTQFVMSFAKFCGPRKWRAWAAKDEEKPKTIKIGNVEFYTN